MGPIIDPRCGDVEDDASSTKRRSLLSLAGSLLAEISLPKLALAFLLRIVVPVLLLGLAPLVASAWLAAREVEAHAAAGRRLVAGGAGGGRRGRLVRWSSRVGDRGTKLLAAQFASGRAGLRGLPRSVAALC